MKTIKDVTFFEDRGCNNPFSIKYSIEVQGNKLRVINPFGGAFGLSQKSRLNKFERTGSVTGDGTQNKYYYTTIVNGSRVYFYLENKID